MKAPRRELADHGAFEAKPSDRRWRFWPRATKDDRRGVTTSGSTWMLARERAVLEYARAGVLLAAQDLDSMPVTSELNGAAKVTRWTGQVA
jgi:hypothetical protein